MIHVALFIRLGNTSEQPHIATKTREGGVDDTNASSVLVPPLPADNVWEKRAEERESAERERAAQQDVLKRLQQQFPTMGEQSGEYCGLIGMGFDCFVSIAMANMYLILLLTV